MAKNKNEIQIQPRLISIKAAAAYLSCSIWAVRTLIWNSELPNLKIGNKFLFDVRDLDAFIERRKLEGAR